MWIKDPDPVFSRIRIRVTQKDRIRIRNTAMQETPTFSILFLLTGGSPTPLPFTDMSVECRFITPSLTQYVDEPDAVAPS